MKKNLVSFSIMFIKFLFKFFSHYYQRSFKNDSYISGYHLPLNKVDKKDHSHSFNELFV